MRKKGIIEAKTEGNTCGRLSGAIKRRVLIGLPFLLARQGRFPETYAKPVLKAVFTAAQAGRIGEKPFSMRIRLHAFSGNMRL